MVLLSVTKLVLWLVIFRQSRDYDETFALVAHMTTIHTLLVVTSVRHWFMSHLDV
jgi:hypothetical protein